MMNLGGGSNFYSFIMARDRATVYDTSWLFCLDLPINKNI